MGLIPKELGPRNGAITYKNPTEIISKYTITYDTNANVVLPRANASRATSQLEPRPPSRIDRPCSRTSEPPHLSKVRLNNQTCSYFLKDSGKITSYRARIEKKLNSFHGGLNGRGSRKPSVQAEQWGSPSRPTSGGNMAAAESDMRPVSRMNTTFVPENDTRPMSRINTTIIAPEIDMRPASRIDAEGDMRPMSRMNNILAPEADRRPKPKMNNMLSPDDIRPMSRMNTMLAPDGDGRPMSRMDSMNSPRTEGRPMSRMAPSRMDMNRPGSRLDHGGMVRRDSRSFSRMETIPDLGGDSQSNSEVDSILESGTSTRVNSRMDENSNDNSAYQKEGQSGVPNKPRIEIPSQPSGGLTHLELLLRNHAKGALGTESLSSLQVESDTNLEGGEETRPETRVSSGSNVGSADEASSRPRSQLSRGGSLADLNQAPSPDSEWTRNAAERSTMRTNQDPRLPPLNNLTPMTRERTMSGYSNYINSEYNVGRSTARGRRTANKALFYLTSALAEDKSPLPLTNGTTADDGEETASCLRVTNVDFKVAENTLAHHTDAYDITRETRTDTEGNIVPPQLVLRRGDVFDIDVTFDRDVNTEIDNIVVRFTIGDNPKEAKGTEHIVSLGQGLKPRKWSGCVRERLGSVATLSLRSNPETVVGKWNLHIVTRAKGCNNVGLYTHSQPIYLLFNPWCRDDSVFMEDEIMRDECVLNDTGKIYKGNHKQIGAKPWNFGQFEDDVLECSLYLLDLEPELVYPVRGDPITISRKIAAVVNSADDSGVLVGNWSGKYSGGTEPTAWVGSVAILDQYWRTKEPVKFGQCWVFSGVVTTVCRALGIPCRSVTNFRSAHDCDGNTAIDIHFGADGCPIDDLNEDSVWNYHVWNEAWMQRPDLPDPIFGGWQAFDATPQETSDGLYQAGPCSVLAVKRGNTGLKYDAPFIFAEVNADKVYWTKTESHEWTTKVKTNCVGCKISTKRPRKSMPPRRPSNATPTKEDPDRVDITHMYKFPEDSEEERAAVYRANLKCRTNHAHKSDGDVAFYLSQKDDLMVGSNFDVVLKLQNKSREERNVAGTITLTSNFYTGVCKGKVKKHNFDVTLGPIRAGEAVMRVAAEEYLHHIGDQATFHVAVFARVEETTQEFADVDDFRLRDPDLKIQTPGVMSVGVETPVKLRFMNPMPSLLSGCYWTIEGPGLQSPKTVPHKDIEPYDKVEAEVTLTPRRVGERQLIASFQSNELMNVTGSVRVYIE